MSDILKEDNLVPVVIDLNEMNKLDESWLRMFGDGIKSILKSMFGGTPIPTTIKGTPMQVQSFANTLGREKSYLEAWMNFGLNDPKTHRSRGMLDKAVSQFTRKTGVKWPFK